MEEKSSNPVELEELNNHGGHAENMNCILPRHVSTWSNGRLEHQVEGDGRREVVSCGWRLDTVLDEKVCELLLGVVVHLQAH